MLGPITSEIARINREKLLIERLKKIQEIETLYVKPDIQVPIQEQLKFPQETFVAYNSSGKTPPNPVIQKIAYLKKFEIWKSISFLITMTLIITFLIKNIETLSTPTLLIVTSFSLFSYIILFTSITKSFEKKFDKKFLD